MMNQPIMMLSQWIAFALYATGLYSLYFVTLIFYRCFFHPLSHIPGPFLARTTYFYEWYYDLYRAARNQLHVFVLFFSFLKFILHNTLLVTVRLPLTRCLAVL